MSIKSGRVSVCKLILYVLIGLYLPALFLWLIGTFGWFEAEKDPLSGVFLIILGQPWTRWVDILPESFWPVAAALSPAINVAILYAICRLIGRYQA